MMPWPTAPVYRVASTDFPLATSLPRRTLKRAPRASASRLLLEQEDEKPVGNRSLHHRRRGAVRHLHAQIARRRARTICHGGVEPHFEGAAERRRMDRAPPVGGVEDHRDHLGEHRALDELASRKLLEEPGG